MRRRRYNEIDWAQSFTKWVREFFGAPSLLAIDLGSSNIRIYLEGKGLIFKEKAYVVRNVKTKEFVVCGDEAYEMLGKTPPNLEVFSPLGRGRVSDFDGVYHLLRKSLDKALEPYIKNKLLERYNMLFSVPLGLTEVEEMAIVEVGKKAGGKEIFLVETPIAAGFGVKASVMENSGNLIVDVGGGTVEVSLLSLGGVVLYRVIKIGGLDFSNALINYLRLRYGILVGQKTAEEVKLMVGSIIDEGSEIIEVSGRSIESGMPKTIMVKRKLFFEPLYPYFGQIIDVIRESIEETPPELVKDIRNKGIILSGMSANFVDLDTYIAKELKLDVHLVKEPEFSVIRGLGFLVEHKDILEKVLIKYAKI